MPSRGIAGAALTSCETFSSRVMRATSVAARASGAAGATFCPWANAGLRNASSSEIPTRKTGRGSRGMRYSFIRWENATRGAAAASPRSRGSPQAVVAGDQAVEVMLSQFQLRLRTVGAVHHAAEGSLLFDRRFHSLPGVPAQVLAGDAHTCRFAVER